ncbi:MAG: MFS transporter [Promethearchaeota archaeon]
MEKENIKEKSDFEIKHAFAFGTAQLSDVITYQTFTFWIFTFYFTIVKLDVNFITFAFIIWSIWNSLNDPLLGQLSDRTHTKWGRRKPWIIISLAPLSFIMFLLFFPPLTLGITDQTINFTYFLAIIIIFELFYTMFSINQTSLFPEMFLNLEDRAKVNNIKQTFSIIALFLATLLPGFFIPNLTDDKYLINWSYLGIACGILAFGFGLIFLKWGVREREEFKHDSEKMPGLGESLKLCLKSKSFRWYIPAEISTWYVYGLLPTLIPLYATFVLNIQDSFLITILLALAFLSAMIFINMWRIVAQKIGPRKAWMISLIIWALTLSPLMWITTFMEGVIVFILIGIGLSGSLILIDLIIGDIIDEDEVKTGLRREASYYGVNALFLRTSTIFVFLSISIVFTNVGWTIYAPESVTSATIFGLRILMFIFPAVAIGIGVLSLYNYPLDGQRKKSMQKKELKFKIFFYF